MGYRACFLLCLVSLIVASPLAVHAQDDGTLAQIVEQVRVARIDRDKFDKKLKSAVSFLPIAQTQIKRAQAELNTATANYAQAGNFYARGRDAELNRAQQAIDRAQSHLQEAFTYSDQKQAAVCAAEKAFADADEHYGCLCDKLGALRQQLELASQNA